MFGVMLHSYHYAWAERAKVVEMPERFAQAALRYNSKAIDRAYTKKAEIVVPSLEEYEKKFLAAKVLATPPQNSIACGV